MGTKWKSWRWYENSWKSKTKLCFNSCWCQRRLFSHDCEEFCRKTASRYSKIGFEFTENLKEFIFKSLFILDFVSDTHLCLRNKAQNKDLIDMSTLTYFSLRSFLSSFHPVILSSYHPVNLPSPSSCHHHHPVIMTFQHGH